MRIGQLLQKWRAIEDRAVRDLAAEIGISPSTLNRLELGQNIEADAMLKVNNWLWSDWGESWQKKHAS